jgi:hypothetical protein
MSFLQGPTPTLGTNRAFPAVPGAPGRRPMAWAVLLRGVNVGGKTFRPRELVATLPKLRLVSLGAAGTFAAHGGADAASIRTAIAKALPFEAEILVRPGEELLALLRADPVGNGPFPPGVRKYGTLATADLPRQPGLPYSVPPGEGWEVQVLHRRGPWALGVRRRLGPKLIYPNEVVERAFRVTATTRWWETLVDLGEALEAPPG